MRTIGQRNQHAADLHWLAYLLTGDREQSVDMAAETIGESDSASPYFEGWMLAWCRKVVIGKALTANRTDLAASARRTELMRPKKPALPSGDWELTQDATKCELEAALLAMDDFPRAVLVLTVLEGIPVEDSAILLDASSGLVRQARAAGLRELTSNLARARGWKPAASKASLILSEVQYA